MLPILLQVKDLNKWQRLFNNFVRAGKYHRISFRILRQSIKKGSMGVPDVKLYYETANLANIDRMLNCSDLIG